jgi:hypothetical protein
VQQTRPGRAPFPFSSCAPNSHLALRMHSSRVYGLFSAVRAQRRSP